MNENVITLGSAQNLILRPELPAITKSVTAITPTWIDDGQSVSAIVKEIITSTEKPTILWNATTTPTYVAIGNWTQDQAVARIKTVLGLS